MIKIIGVNCHRNGVGGTGFYAVRFDIKKQRMVGIVFPDRASIAVLDVDLLAGEAGVGDDNRWRGDEYEDDLREAVLEYETGRSGLPVLPDEERRELLYGRHECDPYRRASGLILSIPEGACVICKSEVRP